MPTTFALSLDSHRTPPEFYSEHPTIEAAQQRVEEIRRLAHGLSWGTDRASDLVPLTWDFDALGFEDVWSSSDEVWVIYKLPE